MRTKSPTGSSILMTALAFTASLSVTPVLHAQAATGKPLAKEAVLTSLSTKLDTKKSKVGDPVAAKTLNPLALNDGTTLPSGSKLTGKVTQVQPKSSGSATLAIEFDQLEKKGAAPIPVHGIIAGIAPLPDNASGGAAANDLPMRGTAAQNAAQTGVNMGPGASGDAIPAGSSIKGVVLSNAPAPDGSSVLQSTDKDIKLETGTRLEIGLTSPQ
jgi:hypothetical protein